MNQSVNPDMQAIVLDEVFPHAPDVIWKALTSGELIGRWLMAPRGFAHPTMSEAVKEAALATFFKPIHI